MGVESVLLDEKKSSTYKFDFSFLATKLMYIKTPDNFSPSLYE